MPKFILNDENKRNSYGFKIRTEGISLERFEGNPIMLDPITLDSRTDFVVEIAGISIRNKSEFAGISRSFSIELGCFAKPENYGYGGSWNIKGGKQVWYSGDMRGGDNPNVNTLLLIKTKGVITVGLLLENQMTYQSFNANAELGDYKIIYKENTQLNRIRIKRL